MNQYVKPVYLDSAAVAHFVSLSEPTIKKMVREKKFPSPRMISAHRVAWLTAEVEEWANARPVSTILPPPNGGGKGKANASQAPQDARKAQKAT